MTLPGIYYKNQKELMSYLEEQRDSSDKPLYDLTGVVWNDNKDLLSESQNLNIYRLK